MFCSNYFIARKTQLAGTGVKSFELGFSKLFGRAFLGFDGRQFFSLYVVQVLGKIVIFISNVVLYAMFYCGFRRVSLK